MKEIGPRYEISHLFTSLDDHPQIIAPGVTGSQVILVPTRVGALLPIMMNTVCVILVAFKHEFASPNRSFLHEMNNTVDV